MPPVGSGRLAAALLFLASAAVAAEDPAARLVREMRQAYARVTDYRMRVESEVRSGDGAAERTRLLYHFRRPGLIRMDFLTPHPGLTLVFPDADGRVRVRLGGILGFLRISLDPGSARLQVSPGQRVDQTGLGMLVGNIARSLGEGRRGEPWIREEPGRLVVEVQAENHFLPGVTTRYVFWIDRSRWLPVRVREEVPDRRWEREVAFEDLELNPGLPEELFRLE